MRLHLKCPECRTPLEEGLSFVGQGYYTVTLKCPNFDSHGTLVPCANSCGKDVPNPEYHYSYTPGRLGSGRWSCVKNLDTWFDHVDNTDLSLQATDKCEDHALQQNRDGNPP